MPLPTKTDLKNLIRPYCDPIQHWKIDNVFQDELSSYPAEIQENYVYNEETRTYTLMETEWLKWRRHGPYHDHPEDARYIDVTLGGSDIAVLFDGSELAESLYLYEGQHGSNFKASVELFYEKTGRNSGLWKRKMQMSSGLAIMRNRASGTCSKRSFRMNILWISWKSSTTATCISVVQEIRTES